MSPAERMQAAIKKLERLRAASTRGTWRQVGSAIMNSVGWVMGYPSRLEDAELVVALHRSIDAQLAILTHGLARAVSKVEHGGKADAVWSNERDALLLADAILGGNS